jgi:uncharacterized protein
MSQINAEITVEEKLRALYDLQIIDSRRDQLCATRGELPIEVEDLEVEIARQNKRLAKINAEIDEQKAEISNKKEVINHANALIEKYKSQQDNVRNNKEFESLEKEIEFQDLEIQLADKRTKEYAAKIDHKSILLNSITEEISRLSTHLGFKKSELDSLVAETEKEENFLIEKSKEFETLIDERLLKSYKRIREKSSNGLAVVGLERGCAKGSYFTIPPQTQLEIAQRKKILIDEHSGKILVDEALVIEEEAKMKDLIKF